MACVTPLRLAVALDGAGWHAAAARAGSDAGSADLLSATRWTELVQEAERGKLDFVTIEDPAARRPAPAAENRIAPGFNAALIAARAARQTSRVGLIPAIGSTPDLGTTPPPFQISTAIATLDSASSGRAGWLTQPGGGEVVDAVRRLWDSWEQGPTDRPVAPGTLDDFESQFRSVDGPSLTVRPPQGQPVVLTRADSAPEYRFAAASADVALVAPTDEDDVRRIVGQVRAQESATDRAGAGAGAGQLGAGLRIFVDLAVFLADTEAAAISRRARLDELHGAKFSSDQTVFVGTPDQLMRRLQAWQRAGAEGFRLHPGVLADDLPAITRGLVPALQENDAFRRGYEARNLRALLGLPRPVSRSAGVG
jgi:alkanesulfonate monooxygenase SsuD/methylene tetrahydromethanopterin reductase-like flavin-dependent oxidoreductase (luciferase family)